MSLDVKNLTVYYQTLRGDVHALEDVSFSIADGEIMGLAGESGCGKTTLSNSLIFLNAPMKYIQGKVLLDGQDLPVAHMAKMDEHRYRDISIVPQYAMNAMNPTVKIGKMIETLIRAKHENYEQLLPELDRRLDVVKLPHEVLNMFPIELSGGMKQRMVMVISTLLDPSLLIADEITSALDVATQKAVSEMLVEFRNQKIVKSMIVVTHDISILYQIADSILVMYAGKLAEKASTEVIINRPRHPYTKLLISSLPKVGERYAVKKMTGLPGTPPMLLKPPVGCRFKDRCPVAFAKCSEEPPFIEVEKGHFVACWKETGPND
jgi:peptide/nickel transport system ATP-binding protein